jgi:hypothetical protein
VREAQPVGFVDALVDARDGADFAGQPDFLRRAPLPACLPASRSVGTGTALRCTALTASFDSSARC